MFGELTEDVSNHEYLALRVRALGHPRTRNSYFVNLQTDGPITTDLWQHRLFFRRDDGAWEDIFVSITYLESNNTKREVYARNWAAQAQSRDRAILCSLSEYMTFGLFGLTVSADSVQGLCVDECWGACPTSSPNVP